MRKPVLTFARIVSAVFLSRWWWAFVDWWDVGSALQLLKQLLYRMCSRWRWQLQRWLVAMQPFARSIHGMSFARNAIPIRPFPFVVWSNWGQHCPAPEPVPIAWPVVSKRPNVVHDRKGRSRNCHHYRRCRCPTAIHSMAGWMPERRFDSIWCWTPEPMMSENSNESENKWLFLGWTACVGEMEINRWWMQLLVLFDTGCVVRSLINPTKCVHRFSDDFNLLLLLFFAVAFRIESIWKEMNGHGMASLILLFNVTGNWLFVAWQMRRRARAPARPKANEIIYAKSNLGRAEYK